MPETTRFLPLLITLDIIGNCLPVIAIHLESSDVFPVELVAVAFTKPLLTFSGKTKEYVKGASPLLSVVTVNVGDNFIGSEPIN